MAATDQQIVDAARDSLLRILETDSADWTEGERQQRQLEIDRLESIITKFDAKASNAAGRRPFMGIKRVNY